MTWCACRCFLFSFCSFLVNFTNLSWKKFNIILIISIYWVELYYYLHFFLSFFLFLIHVFFFCCCSWGGGGGGGCISIHEKDNWGSILLTIYVLVYYILFFHFLQLWLLSLNVMCCGLQLVLWFHLLALLNLVSRLQGFIEQLLVPCNWWHPLGACWSACKTKPLQTGVKGSWVFCRIKVAWSCYCFAWEQMID